MRSGSAFDSALNTTSVILCEVSTLPPATEAGCLAFTTVPEGAITVMGSIRPALAGTSDLTSHRNSYETADSVIASTAFMGPLPWGLDPRNRSSLGRLGFRRARGSQPLYP